MRSPSSSPGAARSRPTTISAFGAVSFVEAAIFLVSAGVLVLVLARAEGGRFHLPGGDGTVILAAGLWASALIFFRVFDRPDVSGEGGTVGIQWGFFVAFVAAGALAFAGQRMRAAARPGRRRCASRARGAGRRRATTTSSHVVRRADRASCRPSRAPRARRSPAGDAPPAGDARPRATRRPQAMRDRRRAPPAAGPPAAAPPAATPTATRRATAAANGPRPRGAARGRRADRGRRPARRAAAARRGPARAGPRPLAGRRPTAA